MCLPAAPLGAQHSLIILERQDINTAHNAFLLPLFLSLLHSGGCNYFQVAERTESDKKGGHLCKDKSSGGLTLRESA